MDVYFSPLACSLASRITLYEASGQARFIQVDTSTKLTVEGTSYRDINPLGQVPALRTDEGEILTENAAVLQYLAARYPEAKLAPSEGFALRRLQDWLSFIGTELHKAVFAPLLDKSAPPVVKEYALNKHRPRFDYLEQHLTGREYLGDSFSVADAYLIVVLNWSQVTPVKLGEWPAIHAYHARLLQRPSVARAMQEELALYQRKVG